MIKNGLRIVDHHVSIVPKSTTPVNVLKIQKILFVHEADSFESIATHQHCRTENPIGSLDLVRIGVVHHKVVYDVFKDPSQKRSTSENCHRPIEAMVRALVFAIEI